MWGRVEACCLLPRIVFTTYKKALAIASNVLMKFLQVHGARHRVDAIAVDQLVYTRLPQEWRDIKPTDRVHDHMRSALNIRRKQDPKLAFNERDLDFLIEEVDWAAVSLPTGRHSCGAFRKESSPRL